jgi:hypothetical protein
MARLTDFHRQQFLGGVLGFLKLHEFFFFGFLKSLVSVGAFLVDSRRNAL